MRTRITARTLGNLPAPGAIVRDTELIGFGIRVNQSKASFIAEGGVCGTGKNVRKVIGKVDLMIGGEARASAKQVLFELAHGKAPDKRSTQTEVKKLPTLGQSGCESSGTGNGCK